MSPQWINRIFEVDPTFEPSMEKDEFAGTGSAMKAALRASVQEERDDSDPMTVLRMGLDDYLATGTSDLGLMRRLRASIDKLSDESARPTQAAQ